MTFFFPELQTEFLVRYYFYTMWLCFLKIAGVLGKHMYLKQVTMTNKMTKRCDFQYKAALATYYFPLMLLTLIVRSFICKNNYVFTILTEV